MTPGGSTTLATELAAVMATVATEVIGVTHDLGRSWGAAHRSPPHVLWTPIGGPIEGGRKGAHSSGARVLYTRRLTLRARCWGVDTEAASDLASAVLRAAYARWTAGAVSPVTETWPQGQSDVAALGEYADLTLTLSLAVLDAAPTLVTLTDATLDTTDAAASDGRLHAGEH